MNLSKTHKILAFVLHEKEFVEWKKASLIHLKKMANQYDLSYKEVDFGNFLIGFVYRDEGIQEPITRLDQFVVCSHTQENMTDDRYLVVQIENNQVKGFGFKDITGYVTVF